MEERNKITENERNIKREKAKKQYCKHHIYNTCTFKESCWKKHVSPREYMKTIRCKYHEESRCRKGRFCEFKHLINTTCRYYTEGRCMRGDMCTFRHIKEEKESALTTTYQKENKPSIRENGQKVSTTEENQMELNFPKDKRKVDQITAAPTQLVNSEELQTLIETLIEKVLREKI